MANIQSRKILCLQDVKSGGVFTALKLYLHELLHTWLMPEIYQRALNTGTYTEHTQKQNTGINSYGAYTTYNQDGHLSMDTRTVGQRKCIYCLEDVTTSAPENIASHGMRETGHIGNEYCFRCDETRLLDRINGKFDAILGNNACYYDDES